MEVKGTSVRGTYDFVKNNFPLHFEKWKEELPSGARNIMNSLILTNKWYPIKEGLIDPIETVSKMFYNNDVQYTGFYMGSYHAEHSLKGIYKFFVRMNNPIFIVERGVDVFNTYFRPTKFDIETRNNFSAIIHLYEYENPHIAIESSIEGWTRKAIEISGGRNVQTKIVKSLTRNDDLTEIVLYWE